MAAATAVGLRSLTLDEYLRSDYEPDADYVDGVLEERPMGEYDHADLQTEIATILRGHAKEWGIRAVVEIRIQTKATRFRVADVCVVAASAPREQILRTPPVLCIEVLSPEDRLVRVEKRCHEYLAMGVPEVWVFDPAARTVLVMRGETKTLIRDGVLKLAQTPIELNLDEVFATLDLS